MWGGSLMVGAGPYQQPQPLAPAVPATPRQFARSGWSRQGSCPPAALTLQPAPARIKYLAFDRPEHSPWVKPVGPAQRPEDWTHLRAMTAEVQHPA